MPVFGGFHLMLEIFKKRGSLFETTHLYNIMGMHRTSQKAIEYVLNPSDPNQANREMIQYHLAVYLSALLALLEEQWDSGLDEVELSPIDVVNFMVERAKENLQAFVILLELRFCELIVMLQRAETKSCPATYCAALKYALLLCVNTNATKYVEMMSNFCIDRKCMSKAELKMHDVTSHRNCN